MGLSSLVDIHALGYSKISILRWILHLEKPLTNPKTTTKFSPADFQVTENPKIFTGKKQVLAAIDDVKSVLINALTKDIHLGENTRYGRPDTYLQVSIFRFMNY